MSVLFFFLFSPTLWLCLCQSPHHPYFFPEFFLFSFIWNYKIYHIWQFLVFIPDIGFQCHSVPVNSGDCSSEITRMSKVHGRSEILAGKLHWNGTRICLNDRNPAGICGASLRAPPELKDSSSKAKVYCMLCYDARFVSENILDEGMVLTGPQCVHSRQ